jgi:predicted RNA-binding Zn-ribbon protein involved in translation (DUF1610 family)
MNNNYYCTDCRCTRTFHSTSSTYECPICGKTLQKRDEALTTGASGS